MRTTPCTPMSVKRFASVDQSFAGSMRAPFVRRSISPSIAATPGAAARR